MPGSPRVLTCAYNRRRPRVAPHNDESTMQTTKSKLSLKSRTDSQSKLSILSENNVEWPTINKQTRSSSVESESAIPRPVFRRRADIEEDLDDDMFVLKRANPVYDSDDEDDTFTPAKRQRTGEPTVLSWCDQLDEDENDGFAFNASSFLPR